MDLFSQKLKFVFNQSDFHASLFFAYEILGSIFHVMFGFCKIYRNWPKGLQNCFPELLASLFWGVKVSDHVHIIETIEVKNWWDTYHTYYKYPKITTIFGTYHDLWHFKYVFAPHTHISDSTQSCFGTLSKLHSILHKMSPVAQ